MQHRNVERGIINPAILLIIVVIMITTIYMIFRSQPENPLPTPTPTPTSTPNPSPTPSPFPTPTVITSNLDFPLPDTDNNFLSDRDEIPGDINLPDNVSLTSKQTGITGQSKTITRYIYTLPKESLTYDELVRFFTLEQKIDSEGVKVTGPSWGNCNTYDNSITTASCTESSEDTYFLDYELETQSYKYIITVGPTENATQILVDKISVEASPATTIPASINQYIYNGTTESIYAVFTETYSLSPLNDPLWQLVVTASSFDIREYWNETGWINNCREDNEKTRKQYICESNNAQISHTDHIKNGWYYNVQSGLEVIELRGLK